MRQHSRRSFWKGEEIIHILLKAGFVIKQSKVKGASQEIHLLGVKGQDRYHPIPINSVNKNNRSVPTNQQEGTTNFPRPHGFLEDAYSRVEPDDMEE